MKRYPNPITHTAEEYKKKFKRKSDFAHKHVILF